MGFAFGQELAYVAPLLIAVVLGTLCGKRVLGHISEDLFRTLYRAVLTFLALRLVIGSGHKIGVSQSMLSLPENEVLGNGSGLEALVAVLLRSVDALLRKKDRLRLIIDVDSTEDSAHGSQENSAYAATSE